MVIEVVFTETFERTLKKLRDAAVKERVRRQIEEIIKRPEIGKPLKFQRRGELSVRVPPFRIIYSLVGDTLYFLDFDNRDEVYRK